ncbi:MAG: hypothetical protein ACR2MT_10955 [Aurantibacter sp.]
MIKDLNAEECFELIRTNYVGPLTYLIDESPYVIPITYDYCDPNNSIISYSLEG